MTVINSTPGRLDMQAWTYRGADPLSYHQTNIRPGEVYLASGFDPGAGAGYPEQSTYVMYLRIRGVGFDDFDANGVPRSGTVTGATLENNQGFVLLLDDLDIPVTQFLAVLGSSDPAVLRGAFLAGDDLVDGGSYDLLIGPGLGDILLGEAGNDTLNGHGGYDTLDGGDGDDVIAPTDGLKESVSVVIGGAGRDLLTYELASRAVDIDLAMGVAGRDTVSGVEQVVGSRFGDRLQGSAGRDSLFGGDGADTVSGGSGDDAIYSLGDGDLIDGGPGVDIVHYGTSLQAVTVDLATGRGSDTISGVEMVVGSQGSDRIVGSAGADTLQGASRAPDTILGGEGDDEILGSGYLRGEGGADRLMGGDGFDDIHGNTGNDTASGADGDDWVVGGKDDDLLDGGAGGDIVYGNIGQDTCAGGEGNDVVRGGQGADHLRGEAGDDWLSGDRGDDVVHGGAGADIFHTFAAADTDRVTDFNAAEGDRVMLDPGTAYSVRQEGFDTVIEMSGGRMILVGVQMDSLPAGWIFGA